MGERNLGLLGEIAAGRPVLASSVVAVGLTALAAIGYRSAPASFASASFSFLAALVLMTLAPAAIASAAPKNFWLRLFYGGAIAGLILAVRRVAMQSGFETASFRADIALSGAAIAVGVLSLGAPLWRSNLRLALIGVAAVALGATGGLAVVALEAARAGAVPAAGAALGFATASCVALSVTLAAAFSSSFATGDTVAEAAGRAAQSAAAPALLGLALATLSLAAGAFLTEASARTAAIVAAGAVAAGLAPAVIMGAGALSLKTPSEALALEENRRRAGLQPLLRRVRSIAPPSSSIAATAILLIATVAAGFDAASTATLAEIVVILASFAAALVVFVSVRTGLLLILILIVASRLTVWGAERFVTETPPESVRLVAIALAAVLFSPLALAWRDNRSARRKSLDVTSRALADGYFTFVAATVLALSGLAAADAGGLWDAGAEAALFAAAMSAIAAISAPVMMTAMGALFGRD